MAPCNLKKMTSYVALIQTTLKRLLAPSAFSIHTLEIGLKRREKKRKHFSFAPQLFQSVARSCIVGFVQLSPATYIA